MSGKGKRILIVEDELLLAMDLEETLKDMGHTVLRCVLSGEKALSVIDSDRPDIVMIDITLDGEMDGIETADHIRRRHDIPVVFTTGNTDSHTLGRANEVNPLGIIIKPITEKTLGLVLQKTLP